MVFVIKQTREGINKCELEGEVCQAYFYLFREDKILCMQQPSKEHSSAPRSRYMEFFGDATFIISNIFYLLLYSAKLNVVYFAAD